MLRAFSACSSDQSADSRNVRTPAPGEGTRPNNPQNRHLVGRVPSPGVPTGLIMRIADWLDLPFDIQWGKAVQFLSITPDAKSVEQELRRLPTPLAGLGRSRANETKNRPHYDARLFRFQDGRNVYWNVSLTGFEAGFCNSHEKSVLTHETIKTKCLIFGPRIPHLPYESSVPSLDGHKPRRPTFRCISR